MIQFLRESVGLIANLFKGHDMRPHADKIVVRTIERLSEARAAGKPLILIIGENHTIPAHRVIQMLVLKKLKELGHVVSFGMEQPHDTVLKEFSGYSVVPTPERLGALKNEIAQTDHNGQISLKTFMAQTSCLVSDTSYKTLMKFALTQKLSTSFNDAANCTKKVTNELVLDSRDPITALIMRKHGVLDALSISATGIRVRNAVIVAEALEHMKQTGAEIYVQNCGTGHLAGFKDEGFSFQDSLIAQFKKAGAVVSAMPLRSPGFGRHLMPADYSADDSEIFWGLNPLAYEFVQMPWDVGPIAEEEMHLAELLRASGFDPDEAMFNRPDRYIYKEDTMRRFNQWEQQYVLPPSR